MKTILRQANDQETRSSILDNNYASKSHKLGSTKKNREERQLAKDNYACVFFDLEKKCCSIYEARPTQCRTFPFWDYFKENKEEVFKECPAIKEL